jgi:hypothetical protein
MKEGIQTTHCWKGYRDYLQEQGSTMGEWIDTFIYGDKTCMLPFGHEGNHQWVSDSEIGIRFQESRPC